jgi:hypothetical protein
MSGASAIGSLRARGYEGDDGSFWFTDPSDHDMNAAHGRGAVRSWRPRTRRGNHVCREPRLLRRASRSAHQVENVTSSRQRQVCPAVSRGERRRGAGWASRGRTPADAQTGLWWTRRTGCGWAAATGHCVLGFDETGRHRSTVEFPPGAFMKSVSFAGPVSNHDRNLDQARRGEGPRRPHPGQPRDAHPPLLSPGVRP